MKKAHFVGVTLKMTPYEQNCLTVFICIFVNRLSVERNHTLNCVSYSRKLYVFATSRKMIF
jgi:hypothetical protein